MRKQYLDKKQNMLSLSIEISVMHMLSKLSSIYISLRKKGMMFESKSQRQHLFDLSYLLPNV